MTSGEQDRRAHPRAALAGQAVVYVGDERIGAQAVDISVGGIGVRVHQQRPAGTFVRVNFALGSSFGDAPTQWLDADGVIVRSGEGRGCWILGVQFVSTAAGVTNRISDYVARFNAPPPRRAPTDRHRTLTAALTRAKDTQRPTAEIPAESSDPQPVPARARSSSRPRPTKHTSRPLDQSDPELRGLYRQALQELNAGLKGKKKR